MRAPPIQLRLLPLAALAAALGSGCSGDPVRDAAISALGPEDSNGPGPDHRPGQPCLLCHSSGGPAASKAFAVAGTVYKTPKAGDDGQDSITVQFVDANGGGPVVSPTTGPTGNFYVPIADWGNMAFPLKVGLYDDAKSPPTQTMTSLIGREGSCNFCHRPNPSGDLSQAQVDLTRSSAGQIYYKSQ
jgi:hypothetical protein